MKYPLSVPAFLVLLFCRLSGPACMAASQTRLNEKTTMLFRAEPLTLAQALTLVLDKNPELRVSDLEIQTAAARVLQAGLRPNPEFSALGESFLAMGGTGLFRYMESTLQLSQRLELGGKRAARIRAQEKGVAVAGEMRELKKADLVAATSQAFAEVAAGQERLANRRDLSRLARQVYATVVERVAAGKVSPVEQTQATVALSSAQLEEDKQSRELVAARDRLAALWGGTYEDFDTVTARFEIPAALPELSRTCVEGAPEMKVASATVEFRRSLLESERAARRPDVTLSAGFRRLNAENLGAWVAGASIPLPLFDRRQGAVAEARLGIEKSLFERRALERRLRSDIAQARHSHETALLEANALAQTTIPAAREALSAIEEGYRFGKFEFLNVLEAQRNYAELQRRHIEAVAAGVKAAIEIGRLVACGPVSSSVPLARDVKEEIHER